jgi:hypothetical protein
MKNVTRILLFGIILIGQYTFAQDMQVSLESVRQFAGSQASVIWGNVYADEPMPLYSIQDELIGYSCNFSIGQPFPGREFLMQQCDQAAKGEGSADRWQVGTYGNIR